VAGGYPRSPAARFLLLGVEDAGEARISLRELIDQVTFADTVERQVDSDRHAQLNVAFSAAGLAALGVSPNNMTDFSREFREGMVTPHRQRILGDLAGSPSDPLRWLWGGPSNPQVHCALLLYARDEVMLDSFVDDVMRVLVGVRVVRTLLTVSLGDTREHFGFRDGISSPWVEGLHRPRETRDRIATGEILLGHPDFSGAPDTYPALGRDGSYLVLRQLVQDVEGFWSALRSKVGDARAVSLAAKMTGRWPDGTPLAHSPDGPAAQPANDFGYGDDPDGLRCPLGAHIRRTNPRDGLVANPVHSINLVNRHRLLRRGRAFGYAAAPETWPNGIAPVEVVSGRQDESGQRGIVFATLGANLARQFEFVQHSWLNDTKFAGLYDENDPLTGSPHRRLSGAATGFAFTTPGPVVNHRVELPHKYVHCIGGEYFFVPRRTALLEIASEPTAM
jgi:Dyp-type peroxidase family